MKNENSKSIRKKFNLNLDLGNSQESMNHNLDKNKKEFYSKNPNSSYINSTQSIEL